MTTQRRLIFDTIANARDLGGCSVGGNGQHTRWRTFVRADHFQSWSEATRQALIDYGVKLVIDLRAPHELQRMPNSFATSQEITYLNIPLLTDELDLSPHFQALRMKMADNHEMYAFMLNESKPQIGKIFTAMATHNVPTLFHCYAGKDRTGIITALLLSLANADHEVIAHDYSLTGEYLVEHIAEQRTAALAAGMDIERFDVWFASTTQTMVTTLSHIQESHGGARAYLSACGVSDEHIDTLRAMLVED